MSPPRRLLIVDQDEDVRAVIEELVRDHGYSVHQAATIEDALRELGQESFDVGLFHLPELRSTDAAALPDKLRVVSMSASERPTSHERVDAHLPKPFTRAELLQALAPKGS